MPGTSLSGLNEMSRSFGYRRVVFLCCAIALGAYHIFASAAMYPVPGGDAVVFMPPAINLKAGRGLSNYIWTGRQRFVEHPPVFQMVVSACMWKSDTRTAFIVLAAFNALTLMLYAAILSAAEFAQKLIASAAGFAVLLSSLLALAFLVFTASGRPETLSALILTLAIAAITWFPQKYWLVCFGIAIGVAAAIHPTHGIFFACLVVITFLFTSPVPQAIRKMMGAAAIALPLFWILLSLGPYPVEEVLRTLSWHAALAAGPDYRVSTLVLYYLKLAPWSGVYLLGLSLVFVSFGILFWRGPEDRITRWGRLAGLLLTAFVFWFFSIRRPNASYYLIMLAPALAASALYLCGVRDGTSDRRLTGAPLLMLAAFFGIFSLCLARDIALFVDYRTDGVSFAEARRDFDRLVRSTDQIVSVSESLWVLADQFDRLSIVERGTTSGDLMILQQTQRGSLSPPVIPGYRLVSQRFISHPPKWFGLPIARTTPGYSFAVFVREGPPGGNRQNHES